MTQSHLRPSGEESVETIRLPSDRSGSRIVQGPRVISSQSLAVATRLFAVLKKHAPDRCAKKLVSRQ